MAVLKEDMDFLQIVSIVTGRFGCIIDEIDIETRQVSITCPGGKEREIECAMAIGDIIEQKQDTTFFVE